MNIVITGGGTGGHLIIAKTLQIEFSKQGINTIFIGSDYGQDKMWFEKYDGFNKKYFLQSRGVMNKKGLAKLGSLFNILKLSFKCRNIFKENKISAVISVGGYSAAPASFAAVFFRYPFFIHEQNAFIGKLNSSLKRFAKGFYSSYSKPIYDYPVDEKFFKLSRLRQEKKNILFLGGSQGANFINELVKTLCFDLDKMGFKIIHQCGKSDFQNLQEFYAKHSLSVELFAFSNDLAIFMNKADICVSRSGASSLWELCANRLPSIFIPFPYAASNHQYYNALFLEELKLCEICEQKDVSKERILDLIKSLDVENISMKLKDVIKENGAKRIVDDILSNIK